MKKIPQPILSAFQCPECGKIVAWTLPGARVYCQKCKTWIHEPMKEAMHSA